MGFYNKPFGYEYHYPTGKEPLSDDSTSITVSDTTDVTTATVGGRSLYDLVFTDTTVRFEFTAAAVWVTGYKGGSGSVTPVQFNGPVFELSSQISSVSLKTNIAGLDQKDIGYHGGELKLDFSGIHAAKGSYIWLSVRFNDPITGTDGNDTRYGDQSDNIISGGKGNDVLTGNGGADKLDGGTDNDTASYSLSAKGVTANLSNPSVNTNDAKGDSYISIENLEGSRYTDRLLGDSSDNKLAGGLSKDFLFGGDGNDTFVFDTNLGSTNVDVVDDFIVQNDTIWLDDDIFTKIGAVGDLTLEAYSSGLKAMEADDRIIYNPASGKLFYDADGTGKQAQMQFALLDKGLALTAADFDIIA
jgi:Ca2+-binding RTX toxin-like protein